MVDTIWFQVFQIVVLIYSVVLHELAHGLMARSMGDTTAERDGRLTLNPIPHLDLFGSILLPLMTRAFGGFMFGYAKPVPYNPDALDDPAWGPAKVGMAGPLANISLAVLAGLVIRFAGDSFSPIMLMLLGYVVWINVVLAFFNLIPVPPLDGHWLLMTLIPRGWISLKVALYKYQWLLLVGVIFFVFPALMPFLIALFTLLTGRPLF